MQEDNQYIHIEEVKSVSDYMKYLEKLDIQASETLFFRGSGDQTWQNKPTIYRDKKFISNEDHIYYDMLSRCSDDFKHCDNTFDNLVMMQHYGVPTRLLDITENPLVALYFACADDEKVNADAKVDIFKIDNSAIKRHDSDTVAMLANLVKMPSDFDLGEIKFFITTRILFKRPDFTLDEIYELESCLRDIKDRVEREIVQEKLKFSQDNEYWEEIIEFLESIKNQIENYLSEEENRHSDDFFDFLNKICQFIDICESFDEFSDYYKAKSQFLKYNYFIQAEKPYFNSELMKLEDIEKVICVKPKQDNPHIIRQSGAFLLFGLDADAQDKLSPAQISEDYYLKNENGKKVTIHIPQADKPVILKQLEALAISAGTLFTDIDKVAADIKNKYRTQ